jgi:hypothetical protein
MKFVFSGAPLRLTTDEETKFVPVTVTVKPALPAAATVGVIKVIVGSGFGLLMLKFMGLDVPPVAPGLVTVTLAVPAVAMAAAGMEAVSCVALINIVASGVPPKLTTEDDVKFTP